MARMVFESGILVSNKCDCGDTVSVFIKKGETSKNGFCLNCKKAVHAYSFDESTSSGHI